MDCVLKDCGNTIKDVLKFGKCINSNGYGIRLITDKHDVTIEDVTNRNEVTTLTSDIDIFSDFIFFKGWYGVEENENGEKFRWAKNVAYINLSGLMGSNFKFMVTTTNPLLKNIFVTIYFFNYNTKERLGSVDLNTTNNSHLINVNIDEDDMVIMMCADIGWIPAIYDETSDDWRELAFAVEQVSLEKT